MRIYYAHMARASSVARKTPTNVSIRADLVQRAKELGLNLSGLLEGAIEQAIRVAEREAWQRDNAEAMDSYNDWVAKHGAFSDAWRKF
jgi:antitoxin CcdA